MPTITGTLNDSLAAAATARILTGLSTVAAYQDKLLLPEGVQDVTAGSVSLVLPANAALVPAGTTYTFRVQDRAGVQAHVAAGVTVTNAMDSLDDIL